MSEELKACPFCTAEMWIENVDGDWFEIRGEHKVTCPIIGMDNHFCNSIPLEEVIKAWNTRTFTQEDAYHDKLTSRWFLTGWYARENEEYETLRAQEAIQKAALESIGKVE